MKPIERLKRVMAGEKADRPPCICPGGMMNMVTKALMEREQIFFPEAHLDAEAMANLACAVYQNNCFENLGVPFCMTTEAEGFGAEVDLGSDIYEPHVTGYILNSVTEYEKLHSLYLDRGRIHTTIEAIKKLKKKELNVPIIGNITGPISTASSLMEPVVFYKELRKKKENAHAYMNFVTNELIRLGQAQIEAGADVIAISDPSGTGEILGPRLFEEYTVSYINHMLDAFQKENVRTIVHICGKMSTVYAQVKEIKSDVLSFDSIVSMKEAKENLPGRILMGNVSTYALEFGEKEKVYALAKNCIKNGSDILAPACGLGMKSPIDNVQAMLGAAKGEMIAC